MRAKKKAAKKRAPRTNTKQLKAELAHALARIEEYTGNEKQREEAKYNMTRAREAVDQLSLELNRIAQDRCDSVMKSWGVPVRARITMTVGA